MNVSVHLALHFVVVSFLFIGCTGHKFSKTKIHVNVSIELSNRLLVSCSSIFRSDLDCNSLLCFYGKHFSVGSWLMAQLFSARCVVVG